VNWLMLVAMFSWGFGTSVMLASTTTRDSYAQLQAVRIAVAALNCAVVLLVIRGFQS